MYAASVESDPITLSAHQLICQAGPLKGQVFRVINKLTVGRETSCDMVLDDPKVSRHHGEFLRDGDDIVFVDNGSTNGSQLNGSRFEGRVTLSLGDVLKLGGCELAILERTDFQSISIVGAETMITGHVDTNAINADALAGKIAKIFDHYKAHQSEMTKKEEKELEHIMRLFHGMRSIYTISQSLGKLLPMDQLLELIGDSLFKVFDVAENLVILLRSEEQGRFVPRYASARTEGAAPKVVISNTVLEKATTDRCTIIANDAEHDERFSASDSIIGFSVKSVICAPLISGDKVLGALYLDNRTESVTYDELDAELVSAFANQCAVAIDNSFLLDNLQEHYHQTLQALVNAIEAKDTYTMGHTARVSRYSVGIARALGFVEERVNRIKMAADLHDIGKIGVKEGIINKPGALTDTEYSSIKDHVEMGEKILKPITYLNDLLPAIRGHHEKWDGSGYPDGLKGEECPIEARILALADAFDAMTSQRSYNKPLTFEQALERIKDAAGTHFDPKVVTGFEKYLRSEFIAPDPEKVSPTTPANSSSKISR
ncbi:MAG: HD domain-containing protein [Candidatus Sumerlaeia bacterium]|nr:HD domain-containing protein [Candidatus Sumerlaeia bacterium]